MKAERRSDSEGINYLLSTHPSTHLMTSLASAKAVSASASTLSAPEVLHSQDCTTWSVRTENFSSKYLRRRDGSLGGTCCLRSQYHLRVMYPRHMAWILIYMCVTRGSGEVGRWYEAEIKQVGGQHKMSTNVRATQPPTQASLPQYCK